MHNNSDIYMIVIIAVIIVVWAFYWFRHWLIAPSRSQLPIFAKHPPGHGEVVSLLEDAGYEVLSGHWKLPVGIQVDRKKMKCRCTIDYFAEKDKEIFVVKVARENDPMDWTGESVRDRLLIFYLLYDEVNGILYVDPEQASVKKILFELEEEQ